LQAQGKDKDHEVYVLRGGFGDFQAKFRVRPPAQTAEVHV
jgi:hypothetical protein